MDTKDTKSTNILFWIMGAAVGVLLLLALLFYVLLGADITTGLNQAAARAAYEAGEELAAQGKTEAALQRYRQALEEPTMDASLRHQCLRAMGDLLAAQQRYDEAIAEYAQLPPGDFVAAPESFGSYLHALGQDQAIEEAGMVAVQVLSAAGEGAEAEAVLAEFQDFTADLAESETLASSLSAWQSNQAEAASKSIAQQLLETLPSR